YPNSGELYNGENRTWSGSSEPLECGKDAGEWYKKGAKLIGGCCRMGPEHMKAIRENLVAM
ncbi:MAG: homocysteine S-methyltransferase family protein, partial [Candidatus Marinimicrobia bacterium]|nr:homocysteine S-methyltransferase family protein [Candidatus Neomarinimicrobiota bacterium]